MRYSEEPHEDVNFEVVDEALAGDLLADGIPEDQYHGQNIWDGEKLVTEEEWAAEQREEAIAKKLAGKG